MSTSLNELRMLLIDQYLSKLLTANKKSEADFLQQMKRGDIFQDYKYLCEFADRNLHKPTSSVLNLIGNNKQFTVSEKSNFLIFTDRAITFDQSFVNTIGSTGWKAHISVQPEDLESAWRVIFPVLDKHALMFKVFNLNTVKKWQWPANAKAKEFAEQLSDGTVLRGWHKDMALDYLADERCTNGFQVTIYIEPGKELESIDYLQEIEQLLVANKIRPGAIHQSDKGLSPFVSVRYAGDRNTGYQAADLLESNAAYKPLDLPDPFSAWSELSQLEEVSVGGDSAALVEPQQVEMTYSLSVEQLQAIQAHDNPFACAEAAFILSGLKLLPHEWIDALDRTLADVDPVSYAVVLSILHKHGFPLSYLSVRPDQTIIPKKSLVGSLFILDRMGLLRKDPQIVDALLSHPQLIKCDETLKYMASMGALSPDEWLNYGSAIVRHVNPPSFIEAFKYKDMILLWPNSPRDFDLIMTHKNPGKCAQALSLLYDESPDFLTTYRERVVNHFDLVSCLQLLTLLKKNGLLSAEGIHLDVMLRSQMPQAYLDFLTLIFKNCPETGERIQYCTIMTEQANPQLCAQVLSILNEGQELTKKLPYLQKILQHQSAALCAKAFNTLQSYSFREFALAFIEKMFMQADPVAYVKKLPSYSQLFSVFSLPLFSEKGEGSLRQKCFDHRSFPLCVNALAMLSENLCVPENVEKIMAYSDSDLQLFAGVFEGIKIHQLAKNPAEHQTYYDRITQKMSLYQDILRLFSEVNILSSSKPLKAILSSPPERNLEEALSLLYNNRDILGKIKDRIPDIIANSNPNGLVEKMLIKAKSNTHAFFSSKESEDSSASAASAANASSKPPESRS